MLMAEPVTAHGYYRRERNIQALVSRRDTWKQPWDMGGVCQRKDELVNDTVCTDGARNQRERRIGRVAEDEVVRIECGEVCFSDAATTLGQRRGDPE
jgi:hypothetical protein